MKRIMKSAFLIVLIGLGIYGCNKAKVSNCGEIGEEYGNFYFIGTFQYFDKPITISLYSNNPYIDVPNSDEIMTETNAILVLDKDQSTWLVEYYDTIGFKKQDIPSEWRKPGKKHVAAAVHPLNGYNTNTFELHCIEEIP